MVEGTANQRKAVPGRFFYEKLGNGVVKRFIFYAQCGAAHIVEPFSSFCQSNVLIKNKARSVRTSSFF